MYIMVFWMASQAPHIHFVQNGLSFLPNLILFHLLFPLKLFYTDSKSTPPPVLHAIDSIPFLHPLFTFSFFYFGKYFMECLFEWILGFV